VRLVPARTRPRRIRMRLNRSPNTKRIIPAGNIPVARIFLSDLLRRPKGSVQEPPKRERVALAHASQTPVSKEDVMITFVATNKFNLGGLATNIQTPVIARRPPYLDSNEIIPPATTKDIAKDALIHKDGDEA
jgi:hypothetical protein